ncbi:hypothetical protein [Chryseobacterium sp.]|uniref:hypothetical protein n=1 Tax=Chryseobacterium sp. TaxID=1871047 RepID=UPI0025C708C8|nr:hypothetical protein [Chryseobacterium sp.]MBV8326629.1 hypothetical protein [Chryseobacterium sp.]
MRTLNFTTEKPKEFGYYFVIWQNGDAAVLIYVNYLLIDGDEFWTWGYDDSDDPEEITIDILHPELSNFLRE